MKPARLARSNRSNRKMEKGTIQDPLFLIVGIGASAGGLEAFEQLFANMPPDIGMAFVLVPHLDPSHASMMTELMRRVTKLEVKSPGANTWTSMTLPPWAISPWMERG